MDSVDSPDSVDSVDSGERRDGREWDSFEKKFFEFESLLP
jgi:hypothetical protein